MITSVVAAAIASIAAAGASGEDSAPEPITGTVTRAGQTAALPYTYIGLLTEEYQPAGSGSSGLDGTFTVTPDKPVQAGILIVQPPAATTRQGISIYDAQPGMFHYRGEKTLAIECAPAGCIVLNAYDDAGQLIRWDAFRKRGTIGDQFMFASDTRDCLVPCISWPVFDKAAQDKGQPRELGIPALVVPPRDGYVVQVLFYDVPGYGRLHLRADNGGKGFAIAKPGDALILNLAEELATTAVNDLRRAHFLRPSDAECDRIRGALKNSRAQSTPAAVAKACDRVLADALRHRDDVEFTYAQASIPTVRKGRVTFRVVDASGAVVEGAKVRIEQRSSDFLFGIFEGSPYNRKAFELARDAGFNFATLLMGWGWTESPVGGIDTGGIDQTFGISALRGMDFTLKAHGVVWLQGYGILPDRAMTMSADKLQAEMLAHENALLAAFGDDIAIWECINEPNVTNVVNLPGDAILDLTDSSALQIQSTGDLVTLINGAHEGDFGHKYALQELGPNSVDAWKMTYLKYIESISMSALENVDIVGLQYYPGFHFNPSFGGLQGPATTPSWLADTLTRYASFRKPVHITEFSLPSKYEADWTSGYWREPWTEMTQADYAEMVFTLAFGHAYVGAIGWWDMMDTKSSVTYGGLVDAGGQPKEAYKRLQSLMQSWSHDQSEGETGDDGLVSLSGYGGAYIVSVTWPNGTSVSARMHIHEREFTESTVTPEGLQ